MKKVALFALVCFALVGSMVAADALVVTPAAPGTSLEALQLDAGTTAIIPPLFPLPHCGDLCQTPGASRGCIDSSGANWKRVMCTCLNGHWTCGIP